MDAIFSRVSIRQFTADPVEDKKVTALMKAAMAAPSAGNQQPWECYVVTSPALIEKLGTATKYSEPAGRAPLCIVPCVRTNGLRHAAYVQQDMGACIENLMLEAVEQGLGTVWMGVAPKEGRMEIVRNMLNIPANLDPFAIIAVGYPAEEKQQEDRFDADRVHYLKPDSAIDLNEDVPVVFGKKSAI